MGIQDDDGLPRQSSGHQAPEEGDPAGSVFGDEEVDTQDLPVPVGLHPGGDVVDPPGGDPLASELQPLASADISESAKLWPIDRSRSESAPLRYLHTSSSAPIVLVTSTAFSFVFLGRSWKIDALRQVDACCWRQNYLEMKPPSRPRCLGLGFEQEPERRGRTNHRRYLLLLSERG